MIGKVGYACVNEHLKPKKFRSIRLATVKSKGIEALQEVIYHNLALLEEILAWNIVHEITMYRLSSDLFPLITHPDLLEAYEWRWYNDLTIMEKLSDIKKLNKKHKMRLSMHPDQYTVINSQKDHVVKASIEYLTYHGKLLSAIGGQDMIIHVGGVYGDKANAMKRFVQAYNHLSDEIKRYLRLENDDKSYDIFDVLELSSETGVPVVFDLHHHRCLSDAPITPTLLERIEVTWSLMTPKIHLSSGRRSEKDRKHGDYIQSEDCRWLCQLYGGREVDVMVEAKKKEKAAMGLISYLKKSTINGSYHIH